MIRSAILVLLVWASMPARADIIYQTDDGSGESSLGCGGCNLIWLNGFQAAAGGTEITSIDIAFGANSNNDPPTNGSAITVFLWDDPTNDGNPIDAMVQAAVAGVIQSSHTDTFVNFVLPTSVSFQPNDWFFVGFQSTDFAVSRDTSPGAGQSWIAGWTSVPDPNDLSSGEIGFGEIGTFGFDGNFLIRANGTSPVPPSSVPAPPSLALMVFGLLLLRHFGRRKLAAS